MLAFAQKTSQVLLHMAVAFGVTYGFTGSVAVGGLAAVVEPVCNVLVLPLHDRAWQRLRARFAVRGRRGKRSGIAPRSDSDANVAAPVSVVPA